MAPDLARGLMLLLIALANVPWFLYGAPLSGVGAQRAGTSGVDALWQTISIVVVDSRSYPLFAFLFGYGIWQLYARQQAGGLDEPRARGLLQRRHRWMLVLGAVHAALLWQGDVIGAYGLAGLVLVALFLRRPSRTLLIWAGVLVGLLVLGALGTLQAGLFLPPDLLATTDVPIPELAGITSYAASVLPRLAFWPVVVLGQGLLGLAVPAAVLLAIVAARHRVLEEPDRHRRLLVRAAAVGIPVGWLGAIPTAAVQHGAWDVPAWTPSLLHTVTGLAGALGYVAVFALVAARVARPAREPGVVVRGLTAVGKRSLSCYLFQSVVLVPLLSAWGLGLGGEIGPWQAALIAAATWAVSVALALVLERTGRRGPAERVLRRLVYRDRVATATPVAGPAPSV